MNFSRGNGVSRTIRNVSRAAMVLRAAMISYIRRRNGSSMMKLPEGSSTRSVIPLFNWGNSASVVMSSLSSSSSGLSNDLRSAGTGSISRRMVSLSNARTTALEVSGSASLNSSKKSLRSSTGSRGTSVRNRFNSSAPS